ncbi:MAG TPA: hypothetical protein DCX22_01810 [Dehalococcoidia bacterium]|nr:hypothetical protein [Dehalococcoidia bacterium]
MYDVAIIGAGVAGSYLAHNLAQRGYSILVLEKKENVSRDTCCTGIVSQKCLDLLKAPDNLILQKINSATFHDSTGETIRLWRNHDVAYILDRPGLNTLLKQKAESAGVSYAMPSIVTRIQSSDDHVTITAMDNKYLCRAIVFATGFGSALPQQAGMGRIKRFTIGAQIEVTVNTVSEVTVYLDKHISPDWFAWLVPIRNQKAFLGLMTQHNIKQRMETLIAKLIAENKIQSDWSNLTFETIPATYSSKTYANRALVVGEAAGQVKPMTGGGIYFSLLSADIAAATLHKGFIKDDLSAEMLSQYQKEWQKTLKRELITGSLIQKSYTILSDKQIHLLFKLAKNRNLAQFIKNTNSFDFDFHRKFLISLCKNIVTFSLTRQ